MIGRLGTTGILAALLASTAAAEDLEPVTVRAHRLTQPLVFDGRLDDAVYHSIESAPAFRQQEPQVPPRAKGEIRAVFHPDGHDEQSEDEHERPPNA